MTPNRRSGDEDRAQASGAGQAHVPHIVVIGGGISGLAAAWSLVRSGEQLHVTVLESAEALGGKMAVSEVAGISVDEGAESFVSSRPEALLMAREVGLETELTAPAQFRPCVWSRGRARMMPRGQVMGIPTDMRLVAASEVLSIKGLLRVPLDRAMPATEVADDISVGSLVAARVGREIVDRMVDPLLGGVYAGRADDLSMAATMPALFREMRHERSLLAATKRVAGGGMEAAGARRGIPFRGIVGGVGRLPGAIAAALVGHGVQIRTRTTVRHIRPTEQGWEVETAAGTATELISADAVILATPASASAKLLAEPAPVAAMEMSQIESASVAVIALAYRADQLRAATFGSGLLVPPVEGRMVKAITYLDRKWQWIADAASKEGLRLMRVSMGRHGENAILQRSDEDLIRAARLDLAHLLGVDAVPVATRVTRWGGALPQYTVGHRSRLERIQVALRGTPTLAVCGSAFDGVGVAACIGSANEAAEQVLRALPAQVSVSHA